jgi:hypothetical protein
LTALCNKLRILPKTGRKKENYIASLLAAASNPLIGPVAIGFEVARLVSKRALEEAAVVRPANPRTVGGARRPLSLTPA